MKIEDLAGQALRLTVDDVRAAAGILKISLAKMRTVIAVDGTGRGFNPDTRRPVIHYEPYVFHRRTNGVFALSHPDLSYDRWFALPYPATQGQRYQQLEAALALSPTAALESVGWGLFLLMGYRYALAGFESAQDFALAMAESEGRQLLALARFIASQKDAHAALRKADWAGFARAHHGPAFAERGYDQRLKAAYQRELAVI